MTKRPITDLPIHTYTPSEKGRLCIAYIGGLPIRFKGPTVESARATADAWRHEEVAKLKAQKARAAERRAAKPKKDQTDA